MWPPAHNSPLHRLRRHLPHGGRRYGHMGSSPDGNDPKGCWGGRGAAGPSPDDRDLCMCVSARPVRSAKPFFSRDGDGGLVSSRSTFPLRRAGSKSPGRGRQRLRLILEQAGLNSQPRQPACPATVPAGPWSLLSPAAKRDPIARPGGPARFHPHRLLGPVPRALPVMVTALIVRPVRSLRTCDADYFSSC